MLIISTRWRQWGTVRGVKCFNTGRNSQGNPFELAFSLVRRETKGPERDRRLAGLGSTVSVPHWRSGAEPQL